MQKGGMNDAGKKNSASVLERLDCYGLQPGLSYEGNWSYKTRLGGCITLTSLLVFCAYIVVVAKRLWEGTDDSIITQHNLYEGFREITVNIDDFQLAVGVYHPASNSFISDPTILTIDFAQTTIQPEILGSGKLISKSVLKLNSGTCTSPKESANILNHLSTAGVFCMSREGNEQEAPKEIVLKKDASNQAISSLQITVKRCSGQGCKDATAIDKILSEAQLWVGKASRAMRYPGRWLQKGQIEYPKESFLPLSASSRLWAKATVQKTVLKDDDWLFPFLNPAETTLLEVGDFSYNRISDNPEKEIAVITLEAELLSSVVVSRRKTTIEIIAELGGIAFIVIIIGNFLSHRIKKINLFMDLADKIIDKEEFYYMLVSDSHYLQEERENRKDSGIIETKTASTKKGGRSVESDELPLEDKPKFISESIVEKPQGIFKKNPESKRCPIKSKITVDALSPKCSRKVGHPTNYESSEIPRYAKEESITSPANNTLEVQDVNRQKQMIKNYSFGTYLNPDPERNKVADEGQDKHTVPSLPVGHFNLSSKTSLNAKRQSNFSIKDPNQSEDLFNSNKLCLERVEVHPADFNSRRKNFTDQPSTISVATKYLASHPNQASLNPNSKQNDHQKEQHSEYSRVDNASMKETAELIAESQQLFKPISELRRRERVLDVFKRINNMRLLTRFLFPCFSKRSRVTPFLNLIEKDVVPKLDYLKLAESVTEIQKLKALLMTPAQQVLFDLIPNQKVRMMESEGQLSIGEDYSVCAAQYPFTYLLKKKLVRSSLARIKGESHKSTLDKNLLRCVGFLFNPKPTLEKEQKSPKISTPVQSSSKLD